MFHNVELANRTIYSVGTPEHPATVPAMALAPVPLTHIVWPNVECPHFVKWYSERAAFCHLRTLGSISTPEILFKSVANVSMFTKEFQ